MNEGIFPDTRSVFIDKTAFISYMDTTDRHYPRARSMFLELHDLDRPLVTSHFIIIETHEWLRNHHGKDSATLFLNSIEKTVQQNKLVILDHEKEDLRHARDLLLNYPESELSYSEAITLVMIDRYRLNRLLTFNKFFFSVENIYPELKSFPS